MKTISVKMAVSQLALAMTLFAGAASADTLTLYTSQPEADAATTVEAFKKAHPGRRRDRSIVRERATFWASSRPNSQPAARSRTCS